MVQWLMCGSVDRIRSLLVLPLLVLISHQAGGVDPSSVRPPWTTSKVVGSPDPPPPYKVVRIFPEVKLDHPLLLVRGPENNRLFLGEQAGILYSLKDQPDAKPELFFDLRKEIKTINLLPEATALEAVYALAFHPDFQRNRHCFICYTLKGPAQRNLKDGTRVSRFTVTNTDPPRIDGGSEEIVLTFLQGGHNGADLHFGPDGMLYISTGDAADPNPPDPFNTGQDISDLLSSILRIDVDHKDEGKNYAVPKDNPFVAKPDARPEVWAYGFRNPWRMSFDRKTGDLFVGDVGWELWESIHRVEKGGNYGWAAMEGPQPIKPEKVGPTPIQPALIELSHTIACSVTGGLVYRGQKFPELQGAYIFGDWETRKIWAARFENDRLKEMPEIAKPVVRVVAFAENHEGEVYFLDQEAGTLHALERNDTEAKNAEFPTSLSQTGLFGSTKDHEPAPGLVKFNVNARQWLDGATAEHWVALPGDSSITLYTTGKPIPGLVSWHNFRLHFPKDAVLMRTLSHGKTRLETQLLHYDGLDWRPYTYAWRNDQMDADLVTADGDEKEFQIDGQPLHWQFQSRSQCMLCHHNHSKYSLAFQPEQLNRLDAQGHNQLVRLTELGIIRRAGDDGRPLPAFDPASAAQELKVADPDDENQSQESRARAYLHANCGHCHGEHGGGTVPLRVQYSLANGDMKAIDVRPTRGDFGLPEARIIKPGDPYASTLYFRMAKFGRDRMPHIGSERPDEAGLELIAKWIESLKPGNDPSEKAVPEQSLANPRSAMQIARQVGRGEMKEDKRHEVLSSAAALPPGPIRDLFEGYMPSRERRLGSLPRPQSILGLTGDAKRGEQLFWSESTNCGRCHRVGERGSAVGPDLSTIGKLRSREELLESLLNPSRRIEPKFATYLVNTTDGRSLSGVLIKRDEKVLVLRDAQGKEITLSSAEVEEVRPSRMSLMPEGQFAGWRPEEAADLLAYLLALR